MIIQKPSASELSKYYNTYSKYVPENDLMPALIEQKSEIEKFFIAVSAQKESFQYAPGKWMLKVSAKTYKPYSEEITILDKAGFVPVISKDILMENADGN